MEKPATPFGMKVWDLACDAFLAGSSKETRPKAKAASGDEAAAKAVDLAITHLTAINAELVEALHNMVALAKPHFSDASQMLALELAETALARAALEQGEVK